MKLNKLQKIFDGAVAAAIPQLKAEIVRTKLQNAGITVSSEQASKILDKLKDGKFEFEVEDEQVDRAILQEEAEHDLRLVFSGDEVDEIVKQMPDVVQQTVDGFAKLMLKRIRKELASHVSGHLSDRDNFKRRLWRHWKKPLELFHVYLGICNEAGAEFNKLYRRQAAKKNDVVFEVLIRLQARGCQIALEVVTLLESGLADGAHARWRSLHEVACVAMFIKHHDQELANRYLLHDFVQSRKSANRYQEWSQALGHRRLSKRALASQERRYQMVINQFGKDFSGDYGWAAEKLAKQKPTFADIEKAVGLEKLRPYYRMASDNVHANARAIRFKLGLPDGDVMLLAGASDAGLADPGDGAAMSLLQLTTALLTSKPNIDSLVMCAMLTNLRDQIGTEFLKAHKALGKKSLRSRKL